MIPESSATRLGAENANTKPKTVENLSTATTASISQLTSILADLLDSLKEMADLLRKVLRAIFDPFVRIQKEQFVAYTKRNNVVRNQSVYKMPIKQAHYIPPRTHSKKRNFNYRRHC